MAEGEACLVYCEGSLQLKLQSVVSPELHMLILCHVAPFESYLQACIAAVQRQHTSRWDRFRRCGVWKSEAATTMLACCEHHAAGRQRGRRGLLISC